CTTSAEMRCCGNRFKFQFRVLAQRRAGAVEDTNAAPTRPAAPMMSPLGHERPKGDVCVESVRLPTADIGPREPQVAFVPTRPEQVQQDAPSKAQSTYSITSSARARSIRGIVKPSALAVKVFTTKSNLVGCSTGMSDGFVPRRILSTKSPARR